MGRKWSSSSRAYVGVAIVLASSAGLLFHSYVGRVTAASRDLGPLAQVVQARVPIERGHTILASELRVARMPVEYAPPGSIDEISKAAGRIALTDLAAGEVVTETRLARVRAGPVASLIPTGLRAFAVPTSLPVGALVPGDHVDVLATYGGAVGQPHTEIVVEGVEVLFVLGSAKPAKSSGGDTGFDAESAGAADSATLILLVSTEQEGRLAYARAFADLAVAIAPAAEGEG